MSTLFFIFIFIASAIIISFASLSLTKKCEKLATRFNFSQALFGMITAIGANAPEISSSISAIYMRYHEIGFGVIIGSNIINLAGLLGISALITGRIKVNFSNLVLNGGIGLITTVIISLLIFDITSTWTTFFLMLAFLIPYLYLISQQPATIKKMKIPQKVKNFFTLVVKHSHDDVQSEDKTKFSLTDFLVSVFCLFIIVGGSIVLVFSAIELSNYWNISHAIVGILILAGLTSIPNMITAIFLAKKGLGVAVVSETFNSNTLNFLTGICIPVLLFGMGKVSKEIEFSILWLLGMILFALISLSFLKGFRRISGAFIIFLYLIYSLVIIF